MDLPGPTEDTEDTEDTGALSSKQTHTAVHPAPEVLPPGEELPICVLIWEDDLEMAETFSLVLSLDEDFVVEIVHDVATCLERLRAGTALPARSDQDQGHIHVHPFDVLLLDLLLRAGHVSEVLAAAAAAAVPQLDMPPVVICTGLSRAYLAARAPTLRLAANNIRVLRKPFDIGSLAAELRAAANSSERRQG